MLSPCTIHSARQVATSLTEAKREARVKSSHYPLGQLAERLEVGAPMLKRQVNYEGYEKLTQRFKEVNGVTNKQNEELFHDLVTLASEGVNNMLHLCRNVVVPLIKRAVEDNKTVSSGHYAELKIQPIRLTPLLQGDTLVQHLQDYPKRFGVKEEYRTFILESPEADMLQKWATNTSHFDAEEIKAWLVGIDPEDIRIVFHTLFSEKRVLSTDDLHFARPHNLVSCADQLLYAYFLTGFLRDNPQDVPGEGVSLKEWEEVIGELHGYIGLRLIELGERRARLKREGRLVIRFEDRVAGDGMHVFVNPDLVDEWQAKGGSAAMLLAAGYLDPTLTRIDGLMAKKEELEHYWARKHKALKMQASAVEKSQRRRNYRLILEFITHNDEVGLPKLTDNELRERLNVALATLTEDELERPYHALTQLICDCYFPGTALKDFLMTMERCGVDIHAREAATFATVEVLASWLADQILVEGVEYDLAGEENGRQTPTTANV